MKITSIRFSDEEHRLLFQKAEAAGSTISEIVKKAIFEETLRDTIVQSESRTAERIADFRNNLVREFQKQQAKLQRGTNG